MWTQEYNLSSSSQLDLKREENRQLQQTILARKVDAWMQVLDMDWGTKRQKKPLLTVTLYVLD